MTRVSVLGLGEAGSRIAADLVAAEADVRGFDPMTTAVPKGVARASDPAAAVTDAAVVLCLTTAASALAAAESVVHALRPGSIYADLNTAAPALKRELAELVGARGVLFADVALLGSVPLHGLATSALASGAGARAFAGVLGPLGMPVEVVSDEAGDAATLKLLRSVFMKGLAASVVESVAAAEVAGRADWLQGELAAVIGEPLLERLLEGSRRHAARRVDEMDAARDLLLELGIEPRIATASAALLAELAAVEAR